MTHKVGHWEAELILYMGESERRLKLVPSEKQ